MWWLASMGGVVVHEPRSRGLLRGLRITIPMKGWVRISIWWRLLEKKKENKGCKISYTSPAATPKIYRTASVNTSSKWLYYYIITLLILQIVPDKWSCHKCIPNKWFMVSMLQFIYGCTWEVAKHERGISVHNITKDADDLSKLSGWNCTSLMATLQKILY